MTGQKTWAIGEEVLATDFNNLVQSQVVAQFATVAARDAWTTPPEGALCITLNDYQIWQRGNGLWRKPWVQPWGTVAWGRNITGGGTYTTTVQDVPGLTGTWQAVANRLYRVTVSVMFNSVTGAAVVVQLTDGANGNLNQANLTPNPIVSGQMACFVTLFTPPAGPYTVKVRCSTGGGTTTMQAAPTIPAYLIVEDAGPAIGFAPA